MITQPRALVTRDAILRGAAEVFGARGYGLASIADIAATAGLTKGALYFHFASKDELAFAVINEQHRRTMAASAAILAEARPALESMILLSRSLGHQLLEDPVVRAGIRLTTDVASANQPIVEPYEDWFAAIEDLTRRAIDEGDVSAHVDPAMFAHFVSPAFTGVQLVSATLTARADLLQRVREMWVVLLPGIVAEGRLDALRELPELIVE
jgi:AcrR family transcriptional regulator